MSRNLDLADIQGGILRDYGESYPKGRYIFIQFGQASDGEGVEAIRRARDEARALVQALRAKVTSALRWESKAHQYPGDVSAQKPKVTFNVAFTFRGLHALGLPVRTLQRLPDEFIDGMAARASVLGDVGPNAPGRWDDAWRPGGPEVHGAVFMRAQMGNDGGAVPELEAETGWLVGLCRKHGATLVEGHGGAPYQDASALIERDAAGVPHPQAKEHFGFRDGISEVAFQGQGADLRVDGGGKIDGSGAWLPHALGEFLLGHPDESQELPPSAPPAALMRNGVFMAYRKLHQNVKAFNDYVAETARAYAAANGCTTDEAREILKAKMVGRWQDGVPLVAAPTLADRRAFWDRFNAGMADAEAWTSEAEASPADAGSQAAYESRRAEAWRPFVDFRYRDDPDGTHCPMTAHIRRVNTRDALDAQGNTSILNNRRRILRRGLPYGAAEPDATEEGEHGVVFLAYCASLFRQFEFIQQQWLNYGLDFNAGNDGCPILGNRQGDNAKFVIATDPASGAAPFICANMPQFVETRGGDYFFVPSMTALRMIAMGTVDPT